MTRCARIRCLVGSPQRKTRRWECRHCRCPDDVLGVPVGHIGSLVCLNTNADGYRRYEDDEDEEDFDDDEDDEEEEGSDEEAQDEDEEGNEENAAPGKLPSRDYSHPPPAP